MMAWLRADVKEKVAMLGGQKKLFDNLKVSSELLFGWGDAFKGMYGKPVQYRGSVEYEMGDSTELKAGMAFGESYSIRSELEHKYNRNWTVSATQAFDSADLGSKQGPYHVGFGASYKL